MRHGKKPMQESSEPLYINILTLYYVFELKQRENEQMNKCPEIEKEEVLTELVSEAALSLREFGRYYWQYNDDCSSLCEKPELVNAINFLIEYEVKNWTTENLWQEILLGANAKETAIQYMSECIAHCEYNALESQRRNPWGHL